MNRVRPFLKWAGNKYRCLDNILCALPKAQRLIEPFTGSASVFINSQFSQYLLAEDNKDLISLFSHLKKEPEHFIVYCQQFFTPSNNCADQYYFFRKQFNLCNDPKERAALFLYLNRHGYNGLCRYNQNGIYNVPFGRYIKPYFPAKEMRYFADKSHQAEFVHWDFRKTFAHARAGDLIYCDPPYAPRPQISNFTAYGSKKFGENEQIVLAELAMKTAQKGITVIISNHDTDFTRHHYRHAEIHSFKVKRSISCHGNMREPVRELIAIFS